MKNNRLDEDCVQDLVKLSKEPDFPYRLTPSGAEKFCCTKYIKENTIQTYGVYEGDTLVSIATATYTGVFPFYYPHHGLAAFVDGFFTIKEFRENNYEDTLIKAILKDAELYGADYVIVVCEKDEVMKNYGFTEMTNRSYIKRIEYDF